jgi:hypothetical protein
MSLLNEYIQKKMSSADLEKELLNLIRKYNEYRGTYLFVYTAAINKRIPDIILQQEDYYVIADFLRDKKLERLDFYIETPGGSAEAAEEIVRCLRERCSSISFIVSGEAKSAGTIMILSGDEILMTETGSLGPIDAQMRIGRSTISAHDYVEWVEEKHKEAEEKGILNPFDATMIAQITPGELRGVYQSLKFAEDLVKEWLPKYKFKNWNETETEKIPVTPEMKVKRAEEIAQKLTNRTIWRSHGRSIKIEDLESIGLKIIRINENPELKDIVYRIQMICKLLFETTTTYKIFATQDFKIFRHATPIQPGSVSSIKKAEVAEFEVVCPKCGKKYLMYAKFVDTPKIDKDFTTKGIKPFPKDGKVNCDCGFTIDISGLRNQLELQVGKKIIIEKSIGDNNHEEQ